MQSEDEQWVCPSFNSYSSDDLAGTAARVSCEVDGGVQFSQESLPSIAENGDGNNNDDDFEFSLVRYGDLEATGEEVMFFDGQPQRPIFPIFNRDLLRDDCDSGNRDCDADNTIRVPLSKLFIEEREEPSSSSSEADEMEAIPPGTYCVWKPKVAEASPSRCSKSKSTGSGSKRWRLRDLLRRSNSDGKDSFIFLTPKKKEEKTEKVDKKRNSSAGKSKAKTDVRGEKAAGAPSSSASPGLFYYPSPTQRGMKAGSETPRRSSHTQKGGKETPKRKSYLPYRQDLVGFFTTVNSLGRTFPPF